MPHRVVLTGAAGFIGSAVAAALEGAGHEVLGIDAWIPQAHRPMAELPRGVRRLDTRNAEAWADLLVGVDVVCHQAALVGAGVRVADLPLYAGHNDLGTAALLAAMDGAGVHRLVQASSMVVYGEGRYTCSRHGPQLPTGRSLRELEGGDFAARCPVCAAVLDWVLVPEDAPVDPRSGYAVSKVAQEMYASAWARQAPACAMSLRYHNVYGPGMPRDTPYSGVAAMFRSSLEGGQPPHVFEDGQQMRDFVHVDDVARANLLAVEAILGLSQGQHAAFNICSGRPVSILDVATRIAEGSGTTLPPVVTGAYRPGDVRHVVADPQRAQEELGFTATVSPETGLRAFATAPLRD